MNDSFVSPTGGYVTPQIRDAIRRSGQRNLMQDASQATREGQSDVNRLNYSKNAAVAAATAPQLVQTNSSSTGSGSVSQGDSPLKTALNVASSAAPLSL